MCGFIGLLGKINKTKYKYLINKSLDYLKHRGPDNRSFYLDSNFVVGFQRLSIQDLSQNGRQPMMDLKKRYIITYNGEIYNFKELKKDLLKKNYKFRSGTDTEVLLNLFIEYKEKCLNLLEGMFSFCIYDTYKKSIFLARDHFGIKPLYYCKSDSGKFIFGSEIKAFIPLIKSEKIDWEINEKKISEQISFRSIAGEDTLIKGVKKLNPGEFLVLKENIISIKKYFLNHESKIVLKKNDFLKENFLDRLDSELFLSIKKNMISDVPIGVALSGGLDSSLIVNYMKKIQKKIYTFSVNFHEKKREESIIDESEYINYIKEKYNTVHKSVIMTEKSYKDIFFKCLWHNDEPINFPHTPGIYLLSKLAKKNKIKVLLGGEGADEIFGGYPNFLEEKLNSNFFLYSKFESSNSVIKNFDKNFITRKNFIKKLRGNRTNKMISYSLSTYLQSIENRLDKMSMANSIEFRVPFIDKKILELSMTNQVKRIYLNKNYSKQLLRSVSERYFTKKHIYRPKIGFSVPINSWMRNKSGFGEYIDILKEKKTLERSIYNSKNINKLIYNFYNYPNESHKFSNAGKIWNLLNLELWIRSFIDKKSQLN